MITETQSCAYSVRDTFFNAVKADSFFAGYTARKNRMLQIQPDKLPFLGVYLIDESMSPDGDGNCGMITFKHVARIGFSVIVANNDQDSAASTVDKAYLKIMTILYTSPSIMNVLHNGNVEKVGIESIEGGRRRHVYGSAGLNNETPFLELQYEANTFFRSEWFPDITDVLEEIDVTTRVNNDPDIIPIETVYKLQ